MFVKEYITVLSLKLNEIPDNDKNKALVRKFAEHCSSQTVKNSLLKLAA